MKLTNREITEQISGLSELCVANSTIDQKLYDSQHVFRGLRDLQGNGVVTGLTEISTVTSFADVNGEKVPCDGELRYRGININDIVNGFLNADLRRRFIFCFSESFRQRSNTTNSSSFSEHTVHCPPTLSVTLS